LSGTVGRHCEERSDEAIQGPAYAGPWIASLIAKKKQTAISLILLTSRKALFHPAGSAEGRRRTRNDDSGREQHALAAVLEPSPRLTSPQVAWARTFKTLAMTANMI